MASKSKNINQTQPKRGQIKLKIFKMIAESLTNLPHGVAGVENNIAVKPVETGGGFKSGCKYVIKKKGPKRGQIKSMMFKMIAKSVTDLVFCFAGGENKAAGIGCFISPATVIPVEIVGEMKSDSTSEIKKN
ncbi:hypothetical protein HanIR_Chr08g0373711 [Helianthus annuus]|nr:hypothetical protein HanIR_Chr08g0373711 [Helianthus annuus]